MTTAADFTRCRTLFTNRMAIVKTAFGTQGQDRDTCSVEGKKLFLADIATVLEADYDAANLATGTAANLKKCKAIFDQHSAINDEAFGDSFADHFTVQGQIFATYEKRLGTVLGLLK